MKTKFLTQLWNLINPFSNVSENESIRFVESCAKQVKWPTCAERSIIWWFKNAEYWSEEVKVRAMFNAEEQNNSSRQITVECLSDALFKGFIWRGTAEGFDFWERLYFTEFKKENK